MPPLINQDRIFGRKKKDKRLLSLPSLPKLNLKKKPAVTTEAESLAPEPIQGQTFISAPKGETSSVRGQFLRKPREAIKSFFAPKDPVAKAKLNYEAQKGVASGKEIPLIIAGQTVTQAPANLFGQISKDIVETPERMVKSISDFITKPTPQEREKRRENLYRVQTYSDYRDVMKKDLKESGFDDKGSNFFANYYAGSIAFLDATVVGQPIASALRKTAAKYAPAIEKEVFDAWVRNGMPENLDEAVKNRNILQKSVHPDIAGGNTAGSAQVNADLDVLRNKGVPKIGVKQKIAAEIDNALGNLETIFNTKMSDLDKVRLTPSQISLRSATKPLEGLPKLPGMRAVPGQAPAMGLSVRKFEDVGKEVPVPKLKDEKSLLVTHNTTERKLKFAERIGGFANPSVAVINPKKTPFESYGDISLIADKELVRGEKTHLADAYSPRFPSVHAQIERKDIYRIEEDLKKFNDRLGEYSKPFYDGDNIIRSLENHPAVALKFLEEKNIKPSNDGPTYYHYQIRQANLDGEFEDFLQEMFRKYNVEEKLFAGYTYSGKRRYKPLKVDEASKIMRKESGEGFNYGLGSYRSKIAPVVKTPEKIKKEAGRLVTEEEFELIRTAYDNELWALKDRLSKYAKTKTDNNFIESDSQLDAIGGVLTGERGGLEFFKNKFPEAPKEILNEIYSFRDKLKEMPTEYFETKFKRPVTIDEFRVAVIPEETSVKTKQLLEDRGLRVVTYAKGERGKILKELLDSPEAFKITDKDVIFNRSIKEIQNNLNAIFGRKVPIQSVLEPKALGNAEALGVVVDDTIKLLEKNKSFSDVVANHEGWHWFKRQLSDDQIKQIEEIEKKLLNTKRAEEIRKLYTNKNTGKIPSDKIVAEELMADEFARYTRTGKTAFEKLKIFFDRLIQKLKLLFSNRKGVLRVFRDVRKTLDEVSVKTTKKKAPSFFEERPEVSKFKKETVTKSGLGKEKKIKEEYVGRMAEYAEQQALLKEQIKDHPGKKLVKFISRKEGEFLDFKNPNYAKTTKEEREIRAWNDKVMKEAELAFEGTKYSDRFDDEDAIREAIDEYRDLKSKLENTTKEKVAYQKETRKLVLQEEKDVVKENLLVRGFKKGVLESNQIFKERERKVRAVADFFGLTQKDISKIFGSKNFRIMTQKEFNNFMEEIYGRAENYAEKRQAVMQVYGTIENLELKKVENLQQAMKLPKIENMSVSQLKQFDDILSQYKIGDEFLSVRKLETVDKTDLAGIKTIREAKERLAKELRVSLEEVNNIKVGEFDQMRWDAVLAERNPFYKMMVDETASAFLNAEARTLKTEDEVNKLIKKARASKDAKPFERIKKAFIPTDKQIFDYLESSPEAKKKLAENMTPEELDAAVYIQKKYAEIRDYLVQTDTLKAYRENYVTHIRRGFLEAWQDDGFFKALKETVDQHKQDEAVFNILDQDTGEILPLEKFFSYSMRRTGGLVPTKNVARAFNTYLRSFEKKVALDSIIPKIDIYTHSLTPRTLTPRGLEMDKSLKRFVNEWLNTKKGRTRRIVAKQGGKLDFTLRSIQAFTYLHDLALNIPVGIASQFGEQITTFVNIGAKNYSRGVYRLTTKQGQDIVQKYKNFVGRSPFEAIHDATKGTGAKFYEALFGMFRDATVRANRVHLLGSLTPKEFSSGVIDPRRLAEIRREKGRYRILENGESIVGATTEGSLFKQYKSWAIPVMNTTLNNIGTLMKMLARGKGKTAIKSREFQELFRATITAAFVSLIVYATVKDDEKDESFMGTVINKVQRDAMTILQSIDPRTMTSVPRTMTFISDLGIALSDLVQFKEYKDGSLKGPKELKRAVTPVAVKQLAPKKEEEKKGMFPSIPSVPALPKLPSLPKLPAFPSL